MYPVFNLLMPIICTTFNFLNSIFLLYIILENRKSKLHLFSNVKELRYYLIFSIGAFIYISGQLVLLVVRVDPINLFAHQIQHLGMVISLIAFLYLPGLAFNMKPRFHLLKNSLTILLVCLSPFLFTPFFLSPTMEKINYIYQAVPADFYWSISAILLSIYAWNVGVVIYAALKKTTHRIKLTVKEFGILVASILLFACVLIDLLAFTGLVSFYVSDILGTGTGFTIFSLSFSFILTQEYSLTLKHLYTTRESMIEMREQIAKENEDILSTIVDILERDDNYTAGHSQRVMKISLELAKALKMDHINLDKVRTAGILHDIGKVGVSKVIINKPGKLSLEEFEEVKKHPVLGYDIVSIYKPMNEIADYVRFHHEKLNGTGYPDGIDEKKIPLIARIISVADIYDALSSKRPYRDPLSIEQCKTIMEDMVSKQEIDRELFRVLMTILPRIEV